MGPVPGFASEAAKNWWAWAMGPGRLGWQGGWGDGRQGRTPGAASDHARRHAGVLAHHRGEVAAGNARAQARDAPGTLSQCPHLRLPLTGSLPSQTTL